MRALNCQNVCRLIEEIELDGQPSLELEKHFETCKNCNQFYLERTKLRQMIGDLRGIEAPLDFDLRLRARMAAGRASSSVSLLPRFSLSSAALATLALILIGAISYRAISTRTSNPIAAIIQPTETTTTPKIVVTPSKAPSAEPTANNEKNTTRPDSIAASQTSGSHRQKTRSQNIPRSLVATGNRIATRDFSTTAANVVKSEDRTIGDGSPVFAIDASNQYMKLSLDDSNGAIRHISLPRVSFGSQRALAGETTSMVRTSARGDW